MRLLIDCTPLHSGGGVQVAIAFLENIINTQNISWIAAIPSVMTPALSQTLSQSENVYILPKSQRTDVIKLRKKLHQLEDDFKPDCVFTVFGPSYFVPKSKHVMGIAIPRLVYSELETTSLAKRIKNKIFDMIRRKNLRRADHLIVETQVYKDLLAPRLIMNPKKISVIGNSLNPILAQYEPTSIPETGKVIILVPSSYYAHKNLEIIPSVAAALESAYADFDFIFHYTLEKHGKDWQHISDLAKNANVTDRIFTTGKLTLPELAHAYKAATLIFLPTLREVSTAVYPESFYFKRPLITSDLPFSRELCADAAIYVDPYDPKDMAEKIYMTAQSSKIDTGLIDRGSRQLKTGYPSFKEKFDLQLALLETVLLNQN